jgi:hypothetical protein
MNSLPALIAGRTGHRCTFQHIGRDGKPGRVQEFTRRRDGTYIELGSTCGYLSLGHAETRLDPSF